MVTHQLQVERRTGKIAGRKPGALPLDHATNQRIVDARVAENVALGKTAVHISTYRSPASAAVDGNFDSASSTKNDVENSWWAVDLGQDYHISYVTIEFYYSGNYRRS